MNHKIVALILLGLSFTPPTQAALVARGTDMVYDTVNNITWAADANLFQTQAASNPNLISQIISANGGVIHETPNRVDPNGIYGLTAADFNASNGLMTWWGAQAWANNLRLGGYTDWKLPTTEVASIDMLTGYVATSQLGDLFYNQLGGVGDIRISVIHNADYNLFYNVQDYSYWLSSEYSASQEDAWFFNTFYGYQSIASKGGYQLAAWAVRMGDVAAVPLPGTVWLFLSGLIGFMGFKSRGSIG